MSDAHLSSRQPLSSAGMWCLALALSLASHGCVKRSSKVIAPGWEVVTETSQIPEAGGYHPFLWRKSEIVHVMIDTNTYSVVALGDDCVVWYGLDSRGLFVACGDHELLLLQRHPQMQSEVTISGGELVLGDFSIPVRAAKDRAQTKPLLTSNWSAARLRDA